MNKFGHPFGVSGDEGSGGSGGSQDLNDVMRNSGIGGATARSMVITNGTVDPIDTSNAFSIIENLTDADLSSRYTGFNVSLDALTTVGGGFYQGFSVNQTVNNASTGNINSMSGFYILVSPASDVDISTVYGGIIDVDILGSGAYDDVVGLGIYSLQESSAVVGNNSGLMISTGADGGTTIVTNKTIDIGSPRDNGLIANNYGLYIANQATIGGNTWAIKTGTGLVELGDSLKVAGNLGFYGTTPIAKQTSGANLTNSVTSGGTDDTIADFTNLTVYATDAATIRNDIYQLARKVKQINDALRAYGLLT